MSLKTPIQWHFSLDFQLSLISALRVVKISQFQSGQSPKCSKHKIFRVQSVQVNNTRVDLLPQLAKWKTDLFNVHRVYVLKYNSWSFPPSRAERELSTNHNTANSTFHGVIPPPNRVATSIFLPILPGIRAAKTMEQKWTPCSALHCAEAIYSSSHNGLLYWVSTLAWSAVLEGKFWRES